MEKNYFSGPFAPMCELFVAQKRATGIKYDQQAIVLRMFDNFCKAFEITNYEITEEIAIAWAEKRPNEKEIGSALLLTPCLLVATVRSLHVQALHISFKNMWQWQEKRR